MESLQKNVYLINRIFTKCIKLMTKIILVFLLSSFHSFSQEESCANYLFIKLLVFNEKSEILLVNWNGKWEVPGLKYNSTLSINDFGLKMNKALGIETSSKHRLNGSFSVFSLGKEKPSIMNYYTTIYTTGTIQAPPGCSEAKWYTFEEAMEKIPYADMKDILNYINEDKCSVYGGTIVRKKNTSGGEDLIEYEVPIYKLADCKTN